MGQAPVPQVGHAVAVGVSPRVADFPALQPNGTYGDEDEFEIENGTIEGTKIPLNRTVRPAWSAGMRDPFLHNGTSGPLITLSMPPPLTTFEGVNNVTNGQFFGGFVVPPDTVGAVGPSHYVQSVNLATQVFSKSGAALTPPFKMSQLFSSLSPSTCASGDSGDPIVLYDHLADRWLITQFNTSGPPFHQCIAVSQTGDPTGSFYVYDFLMPGVKFNDYPHLGIWPDGYYMTDHQFNAAGTAFLGQGVFAFDRTKILAGDPTATFLYFDLFPVDTSLFGFLPASLDGPPPPPGTPNTFAMFVADEFGSPGGDGLRLWEFHADFATPANSTFNELTTAAAPLPVAAFDPITPTGRGDIAQPPPSISTDLFPNNNVDSIADRLMHRMQYRYRAGTNTGQLVLNHTVDTSGDPSAAVFRAGIRYYQLAKVGAGAWSVAEQATYSPDTANRWMGSAASDNSGDIAVGFSVTRRDTVTPANNVFPGLRYAGRLVGDPPGGLAQGETDLVIGGNSQRSTGTGQRWGDYSALTVDPVDQCTFWYTSEYYSAAPPAGCSTTRCWQTKIGSFKFPSCASPPAPGFISGKVTDAVTGANLLGATVVAGNATASGYAGPSNSNGQYTVKLDAGTYNATASKTGYAPATASGVVVASNGVATRNFALTGVPIMGPGAGSFSDTTTGGNANSVIDVDECFAVNASVKNTGAAAVTGVVGTLSTPNSDVTVTTPTSNYGTVAPFSTVNSPTPYRVQTGTAFVPGTPLTFNLNFTASNNAPVNQSFTFPTGSIGSLFGPFGATGPVAIPDNSATGATLPINVSGITSPVFKVTARVYITHTFVGDLTLRLIGPDATTVILSAGQGGAGANFGNNCPADANDTGFDDAAATSITSITAAGAPFASTFRPEQPLSAFRGKNGNGTWQLFVVDGGPADTGNIECVSLTINGTTSTSPNCSIPITAPSGAGSSSPSSVAMTASSLLTVAVSPGTNPVSTGVGVTANLTSIGGSATQQLFDDGTNGDLTGGDGTYSYLATVPLGTAPGAKSFTATITDAQARSSTTSIPLTVLTPTAPTASGLATPNSAAAGAPTLLTVAVTNGTNPTSSGVAVVADLSSIGGSATQTLYDDGTNGDVTGGDGTYSFGATVALATSAGPKVLPVSVTDGQGRSASTSIGLNVPSPGNPSGIGLSTPTVVLPGGVATLTVSVSGGSNPASTGLAVIVDLSAIGGSATQAFYDDGSHGDQVANDGIFTFATTVPLATATGVYNMTATITDAQSRSGSAMVTVDVRTDDMFKDGYE